jgi:hypothetical protein
MGREVGHSLASGLNRPSRLPNRQQFRTRSEAPSYSNPSPQLIAPPTSSQISSHKRSSLRLRARIRSTADRSAGG